MPAYRFYSDSNFTKGDLIELRGEEGRHAALVMRRAKGDCIELINGKGALAKGLVIDQHSLGIKAMIVEVKNVQSGAFALNLVQVMPRWESLCWIVEKVTELGIVDISVVLTSASKESITPRRLQRLQSIMISSLKQSGELFLPNLKVISENELYGLKLSNLNFFADVKGESIPPYPMDNHFNVGTLYVGNEGGFSPHQINWMIEAGMQSVNIHPNTLRVETAAICGVFFLRTLFR